MSKEKPLFNSEHWQRIRALANRVEDAPADQRAHLLAAAEREDPDVAAAARVLLGEAPSQNADPPSLLLRGLPLADAHDTPERLGPFRLIRRIGSGGMGVVHLAEREGAQFTQRVALKVLGRHRMISGDDALREQRVLAGLAHPNITAFIDAGTENGLVWLAMEYVDGVPLTEYCDRHALDTRARVKLFVQICAAVAHAHGQLVVHRDLKPSNVLVTAEGSVKLLDFGIARVLDPLDDTPQTRICTPEYAAPEQLRGERVTVATDVYALGLVLYELVAGRRLPNLEHGLANHEWTTRELAERAAQAASVDNESPAPASRRDVVPALRADLGRIIAHALAPEPSARYGSVPSLRADLVNWLDCRPINISRPTIAYVMARFSRRHRLAVAIGIASLACLLALSGIALWQAQRARTFAERVERAQVFLDNLFSNADPYNSRQSKDATVEMLRRAMNDIDQQFADVPELHARLGRTVAQAMIAAGDVKVAREWLERIVADTKTAGAVSPAAIGGLLGQLGLAREESGDIDGARTAFAEAHERLRSSGADYATMRLGAASGLAKLANLRGDHELAQRLHEEILNERLAREGPDSADIAMDLMNIAADRLYAERFQEAARLARQSLTMLERTVGADHPRSVFVANILGLALTNSGRFDEAIATLQAARELALKRLPKAPVTGNITASLGWALYRAGRKQEAAATLRSAIELAPNNPRRGSAEMALGLSLLDQDPAAALPILRKAHDALLKQKDGSDEPLVVLTEVAIGAALAATGQLADGEKQAVAARERLLAGPRAGSWRVGDINLLLAAIMERKGDAREASRLRAEAAAIFARMYDHDRRGAPIDSPPTLPTGTAPKADRK